jgi:hypothetical protein
MNKSKMYICIKKSLPSHKVLGAAHGVLMAHLKFQERLDYQAWLKQSFRKVVCEVSDIDFEILKAEQDYITVTESGLGGMEIALVFCPRAQWPERFRQFPLLKV